MTALVGILNKRAAVIAADSAVTITNGDNRKIINNAKKLFRLSNSNPVGIMLYSSAEFMDIPWDVLIKLYRDKNSGKTFDTLQEYVDDFINFLRHNKNCIDKDSQANYLNLQASLFFKKIRNFYKYRLSLERKNDLEGPNKTKIINKCLSNAFDLMSKYCKNSGNGSEFDGYTQQQFHSYAKEALDKLDKLRKENDLPGSRSRWEKEFYSYIISNYYLLDTGLVFVGYGNEDIFPSIIALNISGFVDDKLRFYYDKEGSDVINNTNKASICPFAQTDIMLSLMDGMHPDMYQTIMDDYEESLDNVKKQMIAAMQDAGVKTQQIEKLNRFDLRPFIKQYSEKTVNNMYDKFSSHIVDSVELFDIEDMVKMAESLISITNLQRHISSWEESVGGPVDVAVITKSEGFVWVNHKQWYQQEMNPQMSERR